MQPVYLYFFKLTIALAVVFLFYQVVLRKLTFYNWNRWYLLGYSLLGFFIPFINVFPLLQQKDLTDSSIITFIPAINNLDTNGMVASPTITATTNTQQDWLLWLFILGVTITIFRVVVQYLSYIKLKKNAILIAEDGIKIYKVDKPVLPFSFGNAVFLNSEQHHEEDLKEIIRHEFVHVKQRHTVDIIWCEILCILNWYNPFAWLIRKAVRQNLEFIADNEVVKNGVDKKQYQYLLLKVIGVPQFHLATQFNFTSLKKRIMMMNKIKSAKVHLLKFLFVLPIVSILLLAFRNEIKSSAQKDYDQYISISGLVIQPGSYEKLSSVLVKDSISGIERNTDENGFFSLIVPVSVFPYDLHLSLKKEGYKSMNSIVKISSKKDGSKTHLVQFIEMANDKDQEKNLPSIHSSSQQNLPDYKYVLQEFNKMKSSKENLKALQNLISNSEKPYWIINGHSYMVNKSGAIASWDEIVDIIIVDGKRMNGEELNTKVKRSGINAISVLNLERALEKYGINQAIFEVYVNTQLQDNNNIKDTIIIPSDNTKVFLKRNPAVKQVSYKKDVVIIQLKSGKRESYSLNNLQSIAAAEKKWGKLPVAPPPPPKVNLKGYSPSVVDTILRSKPATKNISQANGLFYITADSIVWDDEKKMLYLNGKSTIKNEMATVTANETHITTGKEAVYVNGNLLPAGKTFITKTGIQYSIKKLEPKEAEKKYGAKGKWGIIEITYL